jgi:hypothetical protein
MVRRCVGFADGQGKVHFDPIFLNFMNHDGENFEKIWLNPNGSNDMKFVMEEETWWMVFAGKEQAMTWMLQWS